MPAMPTPDPSAPPPKSNPFHTLARDDRSGIVVFVSIFLALTMLSCIAFKVLLRRRVKHSFDNVDYLIFVGAAFLVAQTICVVWAGNNGLGKHISNAAVNADLVAKLQYAASLLALLSIYCAKFSVCVLIKHINDMGRVALATQVLLGLVAASAVSSIFATAFQCPIPPWVVGSPSSCPAAAPIYLYSGAINIITDVALCVHSVAMMWPVQTYTKRKFAVIALFTSRILCPIVTAMSLISTDHLYQDGEGSDFTWLAVFPTAYLQASYNLSIITACIPSMKYVFDSLHGGFTGQLDTPYVLTTIAGQSGLHATSHSTASGPSSGLDKSYIRTLRGHKMKLSPISTHHRTDVVSRVQERNNEPRSESVQNLQEGVILVKDEVSVRRGSRASEPDSSSPVSPPTSREGPSRNRNFVS